MNNDQKSLSIDLDVPCTLAELASLTVIRILTVNVHVGGHLETLYVQVRPHQLMDGMDAVIPHGITFHLHYRHLYNPLEETRLISALDCLHPFYKRLQALPDAPKFSTSDLIWAPLDCSLATFCHPRLGNLVVTWIDNTTTASLIRTYVDLGLDHGNLIVLSPEMTRYPIFSTMSKTIRKEWTPK